MCVCVCDLWLHNEHDFNKLAWHQFIRVVEIRSALLNHQRRTKYAPIYVVRQGQVSELSNSSLRLCVWRRWSHIFWEISLQNVFCDIIVWFSKMSNELEHSRAVASECGHYRQIGMYHEPAKNLARHMKPVNRWKNIFLKTVVRIFIENMSWFLNKIHYRWCK